MAIKTNNQLSFADISASRRKCKHTFFDQLNKLINWQLIEKELRLYYPKGLRLSGKPAYSPLLLFKMLLLQTNYVTKQIFLIKNLVFKVYFDWDVDLWIT